MCGRFASKAKPEEIKEEFDVEIGQDILVEPRYNIAPTQIIAVVLLNRGNREITNLKWGLVPSWAKDDSMGSKLINARAETLAEKPSFREAFRRRRCLIPASGFYEWQKTGAKGAKQPYYFYLKEKDVFGFAGLWEEWVSRTTGEHLKSCTIITTEANEVLKPVHDRMPVIIKPEDYERWLDLKKTDTDQLQTLLVPYSAKEMASHTVSPAVNVPTVDSPKLIMNSK